MGALRRQAVTAAAVMTAGLALSIAVTSLIYRNPVSPVLQFFWKPAPPTYYISPSGSNSAAGTSPASAWRSLSRISTVSLKPGTRLLLQGGKHFTGQLRLTQRDGGSSARLVTIGSYGRGRATIDSKNVSAIVIYDTAGIDIHRLILVGRPTQYGTAGIKLYSDLSSNRRLQHVSVSQVNISHFPCGISIGAGDNLTGFRDVTVRNSVLHDNRDAGLLSYGPSFNPAAPTYVNQDISVFNVTAFANHGDPKNKTQNTGSGIVLGNVKDATIAQSTTYDNGGRGGDEHQGPQGIWTYDSTHVVIANNVSYENRSSSTSDGGGYDLDQNTSDSVLEYNLSYRNAGPGFLLYSGLHNKLQSRNVVRFNISSGDAWESAYYGGISVLGQVRDAAVYQNTVVMAPRGGSAPSPALRLGRGLRGITIQNDIFVTHQAGPVVAATSTTPKQAALLQGNDYFSASGNRWSIAWGPTHYASLAAWRSGTGQETVAGVGTGFAINPGFSGPTLRIKPAASSAVRGFQLRADSPLVGAGLNLTRSPRRSYVFGPNGLSMLWRRPNVGAR